jgi:hypothetical protein
MPTDPNTLLGSLKIELNKKLVDDEALDAILNKALVGVIGTFERATSRNLTVPADGDPDTIIMRPVNGGLVRLPDAREVTLVESAALQGGPWVTVAPELYETQSWQGEDTAVWMRWLAPDAAVTFCRVTGKFGLFPLPDDVERAIIALAAHRYRGRGGEANGQWAAVDGLPAQSGARVSPEYTCAVKDWKVPTATIQSVDVSA